MFQSRAFIASHIALLLFLPAVAQSLEYFLGGSVGVLSQVAKGFLLACSLVAALTQKKYSARFAAILVFAFWVCWSVRLFHDHSLYGSSMRLPLESYFLLGIGGTLIPALSVGFKTGEGVSILSKNISAALLLCFSAIVILLYGSRLGEGYVRLGTNLLSDARWIEMNPLIVGYTGAIGFGIAICSIVAAKRNWSVWIIHIPLLITSGLSILIGGSRGPFVLTLYYLLIVIIRDQTVAGKSAKSRVIGLLVLTMIVALGLYYAIQLNSGAIDRLLGTRDQVELGGGGSERLEIWQSAIDAWMESPLIGSGLELYELQTHPHNVFLEMLLTTGVLGAMIAGPIMIFALWKSFLIFKSDSEWSWIATTYMGFFILANLSSSLYLNHGLFISMMVVLGLGGRKATGNHLGISSVSNEGKHIPISLQRS